MLEIKTDPVELWDERIEEFVYIKGRTLFLEHSLISISKWESKWNKPFLSKEEKTKEEMIDYIKCMAINKNVNNNVFAYLSTENINKVKEYIDDPMTASTVKEEKNGTVSREQITSELIYYWMVEFNIPSEYQKWHLNRLLMLIKICNAKSKTPKKRSQRDLYNHHAAINAANRKKYNSKG